ncbi:MAG: gfo/Idh/MocA family oxidoreductase [Gammaproteobacteria bacterium]|nr:MAG: gfo/Idh/MocA family oxidoreductase [Gammaproteobacteria bacterium]
MKPLTRRNFLKTALTTSAIAAAPFNILKAGPSPNSKLNIAFIGFGNLASTTVRQFTNENIVAFCDVDETRPRKSVYERNPSLKDVKIWKDYRVMFDKIGKDIDAVYVATPDHVHFAPTMYAMKRGKHVYTQKPLTHTVNEARLLTKAAAKYDVITQMGNQGMSREGTALTVDWFRAGLLGPVKQVDAKSYHYFTEKPLSAISAPPATLDWDLYLNRTASIPFRESYKRWHNWTHFGNAVGIMGSHALAAPHYALELGAPLSVIAKVEKLAMPGSFPGMGVVTWEFAARGNEPPVTMNYYMGGKKQHETDAAKAFGHPKHLEAGRKIPRSCYCLVGEKCSIMGSHTGGVRIIPETMMQKNLKCPRVAPRVKGGHAGSWISACKGEGKTLSSFDWAGPYSEMISLGNVALLHPNVKLLWDSKNMKITNHETANKSPFIRRPNRDEMNWV